MRSPTLSPGLIKIIVSTFIVVVAAGLIWQVIMLSNFVPFHDWDEAIYAQVAREWSKSPSLTLHYNGAVWFEKPPVPFILMGAVFALLGSGITTVLVIRLISVILGVASLWCVFTITRQLTKRTILGLLAACMYITSGYFLDRSSIVNVDIYLTLGWLLYVISENLSVRVLAILLGVGSKSLLGFVPLIVEMCYVIGRHNLTAKKIRNYLIEIILGSVWYVIMYIKFGWSFIQSHFLDHLVARILRPIELHSGDKFYYLEKIWQDQGLLLVLAFLGAVVLVSTLIKQLRASPRNSSATTKLGFLLIIIPTLYICILTVGKAKLHWYIMPIIPFVSILAALGIQKIHDVHRVLKILPIFVFGLYFSFFIHHITAQDFSKYSVPDKTKLARCISETSLGEGAQVVYLVSPQERTDAGVIEAAKLQIGSSFIYGSAPSFVFYSQKPVLFYYSPSKLAEDILAGKLVNSQVLIIHEKDLDGDLLPTIADAWGAKKMQSSCIYGPWRAFIRDN